MPLLLTGRTLSVTTLSKQSVGPLMPARRPERTRLMRRPARCRLPGQMNLGAKGWVPLEAFLFELQMGLRPTHLGTSSVLAVMRAVGNRFQRVHAAVGSPLGPGKPTRLFVVVCLRPRCCPRRERTSSAT